METDGRQAVALTIAGSDSGGGAGIEADLRAFGAFGVHGCAAITAITAQNPFGVGLVQAAGPELLRDQLARVAAAFDLGAVKTGMLLNAALAEAAADFRDAHPRLPWVIDPVLVSTSGTRLLDADAAEILERRLLPRATLLTPNLPEAAALLRAAPPTDTPGRRKAARALADRFGAAVLLKGGHAPDAPSEDWLAEPGGALWRLASPHVPTPLTTHGTGCALSAAIAANLALGRPLSEAARRAKHYLLNLLAAARPAGRAAVYAYVPDVFPPEAVRLERA